MTQSTPELLKESNFRGIPSPSLSQPSFFQTLKKVPKVPNSSLKKRKYICTMKLEVGMKLYYLLSNMGNIQPQISLRQLLAISLACRSELSSSLITKCPKLVDVVKDEEEIIDVNDISIDPGAPIVDFFIDGTLIEGAQIESGSSVNLMIVDTIDEISLKTIATTLIILRMANQSWIKPLDIFRHVLTIIWGLEFKIDFIVFKVTKSISSYTILLGRPWLFDAKVKDDWGRGIITIGKRVNKIILPMYPTKYQKSTQDYDSDETSNFSYDSDDDSSNYVKKEIPPFKILSLGEYYLPKNQSDSDDEILF